MVSQEKNSVINVLSLILFTIVYFIFLYFRVNPALMYAAQEPILFLDSVFLKPLLTSPGGPAEFASLFLLFVFKSKLLASVIITLIGFGIVSFLIKALKPINAHILSLIVFSFLFIYSSDYDFSISFQINLILVLGFFAWYKKIKSDTLQIAFVLVSLLVLFYTSGAMSLIFAILLILDQIINKRNWSTPLIAVVFLAILFTLSNFVLGQSFSVLVSRQILTEHILGFLSPIFLGVLIVLTFLAFLLKEKASLKNFAPFLSVGTLAILVVLLFFVRPVDKDMLTLKDRVMKKQWADIVEKTPAHLSNQRFGAFFIGQALYHQGELANKLFQYPQPTGSDGLVNYQDGGLYSPIFRARFYYDMGLINEGQRWAHEALSIHGPNPINLETLAKVYLFKGYTKPAEKYIANLKEVPFASNLANELATYCEHTDEFFKTPETKAIVPNMVNTDFIITPNVQHTVLEQVFLNNPQNRMAFEYSMMSFLLDRRLDKFIQYLPYIPKLGYTHLPVHFEEAILLILSSGQKVDINLPNMTVDKNRMDAFKQFQKTIKTHQKDFNLAKQILETDFDKTFWFYFFFNQNKNAAV